jgi:replicative DNA helicase
VTDVAVAERQLPHNLEAERSILGAVLLHSEALNHVGDLIAPGDFFRDAHRRIFRVMTMLHERQIGIDFTTVREELTRAGELDAVGGPAYIAALVDGVPRAVNVEHYAAIVREKAKLRRLIYSANTMLTRAYQATEEADVVLEEAERTILGLADQATTNGFESMRSIAVRGMAHLERICSTRQAVTGVPSGFTDLDNLTRGFQPGTLVVVGARPGVGKSSFATNIAQYATSTGRTVGIFSLEMPSEELFFRQIAATARIDSHRLQSGYVGEREWTRVAEACNAIAEAPMYLDETPAIGLFALRSRARRLKAEHGLDLLVLDYLQLMETSPEHDNRTQAIGAITGALKAFAKELRIPILMLSQLNRESAKPDKPRRPQLSDLRDSGSIEQDADIVLFLHREDPDEPVTDLIIAKHRNGPVGTVKLTWFEQQTRFDNYSDVAEPSDQRLPMGNQ